MSTKTTMGHALRTAAAALALFSALEACGMAVLAEPELGAGAEIEKATTEATLVHSLLPEIAEHDSQCQQVDPRDSEAHRNDDFERRRVSCVQLGPLGDEYRGLDPWANTSTPDLYATYRGSTPECMGQGAISDWLVQPACAELGLVLVGVAVVSAIIWVAAVQHVSSTAAPTFEYQFYGQDVRGGSVYDQTPLLVTQILALRYPALRQDPLIRAATSMLNEEGSDDLPEDDAPAGEDALGPLLLKGRWAYADEVLSETSDCGRRPPDIEDQPLVPCCRPVKYERKFYPWRHADLCAQGFPAEKPDGGKCFCLDPDDERIDWDPERSERYSGSWKRWSFLRRPSD